MSTLVRYVCDVCGKDYPSEADLTEVRLSHNTAFLNLAFHACTPSGVQQHLNSQLVDFATTSPCLDTLLSGLGKRLRTAIDERKRDERSRR